MIGIAVVGYGYWGPNLVRNFMEMEGATVPVVCDLDDKRLTALAKKYPSVRTTRDFGELLQMPGVDAVCIATPAGFHYPMALRALEYGKHVLVEKPLATSIEEAQRLVELAERKGRVLMVDHTFIYTPAVRKIKELLETGELGEIYYYDSVRVNLGLFQHDVNVLWDLAIHDLSILDYLLGREPAAVSATGASHVPGQPENIAYLTAFFDGGLIAHIHANWLAPVKVRRTLIGGSQKMVMYDDLDPSDKVKVYDKGISCTNGKETIYQMLISYRTGDAWLPKLELTEGLAVEARHFTDCIRGNAKPLSGGAAGLRTVRILEAASRSLASRGCPVELAS
jgi:predicted dehydrogenase